MSLIVVCGALANKPGNGGAAWTRLSWALGLRRLRCEVFFVEQIAAATCVDAAGEKCDFERSTNLTYFKHVTDRFGLSDRSALIAENGRRSAGLGWGELLDLADEADLLVNISGHLTVDPLKARFKKRVFLDLDPGYTQFWCAAGLAEEHLRDHHFYFTIGENIGRPGCEIPLAGVPWRPIRQPVVLDEWPVVNDQPRLLTCTSALPTDAIEPSATASHEDVPRAAEPRRFTTVASWRGPYGRVTHNGVQFGVKAHEFRKFLALPMRSDHEFEIALDVDPADRQDAESLTGHGWRIVDPRLVAADPFAFRRYIQESSAEFSVAQGIYVDTRSGWFSDRTVRYLASGKPVLVQDTGFGETYPVGCGLVPFRTLAEAVSGAERINRDYARHARAARQIAEGFFDSDKVLQSLLQAVEVAP
jgi:hypothetical protein